MLHESDSPSDRLDDAIRQFKDAKVDEIQYMSAENKILSQFQGRKQVAKTFVWASTGLATAVLAVAMFVPSRSALASELKAIALNGDKGLRHVVQYTVKPDGTRQPVTEFYALGDRARLLFRDEKTEVVWRNGKCTIFHPDGSASIQTMTKKMVDWVGFSAKAVLNRANEGTKAKLSVERGVTLNGVKLDRYTSEADILDGQRRRLHSRVVLYADPATQKPVREESDVTGFDKSLTVWDYPNASERFLDGPKLDPKRTYDEEFQRKEILTAITKGGPTQKVGKHRVELLDLLADEHGDLAAIVQADYSYPCNYGVKINGQIVSESSQDPAVAWHYARFSPSDCKGKSILFVFGSRTPNKPAVKWPEVVTLEVPVVEENKVIGYAPFPKVAIHRTWNVYQLLHPVNVPFWLLAQATKGAGSKAVQSD